MDMQEKINEVAIKWADEYDSRDPLQIAKLSNAIIAVLREQEPVHWRAVLDKDQVPQQLNPDLHVVGFRQFKAAESWTASRLDFDGWRYAIEPLYALPIPPVDAQLLGEIKTRLHYPQCWDTAAYPTFADALHEALGGQGCSTCGIELPVEQADSAFLSKHSLREALRQIETQTVEPRCAAIARAALFGQQPVEKS